MNEAIPQEISQDLHIFSKSLPLRVKLLETLKALGKTDGEDCLAVGVDNAALIYHLMRHGGNWYAVVSSQEAAVAAKTVLSENNVFVLNGSALPFKKKVFDAVVVSDTLERLSDPEALIMECNRIIREDGRLVLTVAKKKNYSLIGPLRKALGSSREKRGLGHPGYAEKQLFNLLKDGFDLHTMRTFSRFFVELVDAMVQSFTQRQRPDDPGAAPAIRRTYSLFAPIYFVAWQLDILLLFTRGHNIIASAKRRPWRARKTPVLSDGRSISEAVLSRAPK